MLRDLKAILYFFAIDMRFSFSIFWTIFIASSFFLLAISYSFSVNMVVSISVATYVFCGIAGFLQTKITFPYSIKFGFTRTRYVLGNLVFNVLLAVTMSVIHLLVNSLLNGATSILQTTSFSILTTVEGTTLANTWYNHMLVDIVLCSLFYSVCLLLGSVFYRLGLAGGLMLVALVTVTIFFPETRNVLVEQFVAMDNGSIQLSLPFTLLITVIVLSALPVWLMLRKASTIAGVAR
ncbi:MULTISPECIES: hypothetical protein [Bacillus]|uniref:hypothetical protein n=1 Tax=Bacillus TaxID=1386 RepID=UPI000BB74405|nr:MULTISPECIES: hypothetical protein [Bacillus]